MGSTPMSECLPLLYSSGMRICATLATMLRCVRTTPFGSPVVPELPAKRSKSLSLTQHLAGDANAILNCCIIEL
jgi:hypothetical protein